MNSWNNSSANTPGVPVKPNLEKQFSIDTEADNASISRTIIVNNKNASSVSRNTNTDEIFRKGMPERATKINLFILEGQAGFEKLSVREKTALVAKNSDTVLKD
ncbi:hypothetical protein CDIK_2427 [Cucumispora dikerogammari]|nr:hypothetical protein CDIK_2427 [Cucumispora dikerogammari]